MYERAGTARKGAGPLWHVGRGVTFFAGTLDYNASHQHGAPVLLVGIHGPFGLRIAGGRWTSCRSAMIPAGVLHELHVGGDPIGVLYIEPERRGTGVLARYVGSAEEMDGVVLGRSAGLSLMRELWEDGESSSWAGEALEDLVSRTASTEGGGLDLRIRRALRILEVEEPEFSAGDLAARVGLSTSRFQHLFTRDAGVPFRRYRAWQRMRRAIAEIVSASSFTAAAHAAGFADQAHFAHDFRKTFGAPASRSLIGLRGSATPR